LAIRFDPKLGSLADPLGLVDERRSALDEGVLATRALKMISRRVDADAFLDADPELRKAMTEEMADLLELARYARPEYLEWVKTKENWTP
jgi:hypothetical protein